MKKLTLGLFMCVAMAMPAWGQQLAPAPRAAPRTPVSRETVAERRAPPHDVTGAAMVIDGDHVRIGDTDLRLFGVVTPQLSANFGPQARAELDAVVGAGKTLTCRVRDRDHDGRLLASCITPGGDDPAYELLRRGLAVAARGSISGTELEQPYDQAEEAAQAAKIGVWSVMATAPAAVPVAAVAPKPPEPVVVKAPEAPKVEPVKVELSKTADVVQPRTSSAAVAPVIASATVSAAKEAVAPAPSEDVDFFTRYQLLIAVVLMLSTALSVIAAVLWQRHRERREELKSLAAALRGELQSARAVCLTRIRAIDSDKEDQAAAWPRIRSTLYQACVARLGMLGAELARQVSSIYGQASDYASYYNNLDDDSESATPKKQALQMLVAHIDEVLPRLAGIERSGTLNATNVYVSPSSLAPSVPPVMAVTETAPVAAAAPEPVPVVRPRASSPERRSLTIEEQSFTAPTAVEFPAPVSPVTTKAVPQPSLEDKFRNAIQSLRERFVEHPVQHSPSEADEHMGDYTAMIEEDIERYSFAGDQDDESSPYGRLRH